MSVVMFAVVASKGHDASSGMLRIILSSCTIGCVWTVVSFGVSSVRRPVTLCRDATSLTPVADLIGMPRRSFRSALSGRDVFDYNSSVIRPDAAHASTGNAYIFLPFGHSVSEKRGCD